MYLLLRYEKVDSKHVLLGIKFVLVFFNREEVEILCNAEVVITEINFDAQPTKTTLTVIKINSGITIKQKKN